MRIDFHTYIGHWPFRELRNNTARGLTAYMARFGIDHAVVSNISGVFYKNTQPANAELAAAIKPFPGKFTPYAVINPAYPGWEYDLEVCHSKLGMKGLRVYPQYHDYKITDPRFAKLLEKADALHMPVALSRWLVDNRQHSWMDIGGEFRLDDVAAVVSHNPGTFLYLNGYNYPMRDQHLKAFHGARVYFDTVYATACLIGESGYDILGLVKELGPERFLFGSAYPFRDPISALVRLEIIREFAQPVRDAIWSGNAQRLLRA